MTSSLFLTSTLRTVSNPLSIFPRPQMYMNVTNLDSVALSACHEKVRMKPLVKCGAVESARGLAGGML